jgi:hypothetical protein
MSSAAAAASSSRPVHVDIHQFAKSVSLMSAIIRAQYLFRANRRSYEMLQRAKRNKMKRQTERDMQAKLNAKFGAQAAITTADRKFNPNELVDRAAKLAADQEAARAARAVLSERRENPALSAVHADLAAQHEQKLAKARAAQLAKCQEAMMQKINGAHGAPSQEALARREAAEIVRQRVNDPAQSQLSKEVKAKGSEVALRSEARVVVRQRRSSVLIGALNSEIVKPHSLKSVIDEAKDKQEQAMADKLAGKSGRRATFKPQDS